MPRLTNREGFQSKKLWQRMVQTKNLIDAMIFSTPNVHVYSFPMWTKNLKFLEIVDKIIANSY